MLSINYALLKFLNKVTKRKLYGADYDVPY